MKLRFKFIDMPGKGDHFRIGFSNIPMIDFILPNTYYLWFLWEKNDLSYKLSQGHKLYNIKKIG